MDIRSQAIALLVEKLREIGADADRKCKQHREAEKSPGALANFQTFADHREAAALNYALAYRCEQLAEEITGGLLFDELDAQDAAAEEAMREAESTAEQPSRSAERHHGTWGPNGEDYIPEDGPEVHALPGLDGIYGDGEP